MTQLVPKERYGEAELEDQHPEFPHDANRFAVGLEDDRKLHRAWLIAGVLSEVALARFRVNGQPRTSRETTLSSLLSPTSTGELLS